MEEQFKNEVLDVSQLPDYQEANLTAIMPQYWNVIRLNFGLTFLALGLAIGLLFRGRSEFWVPSLWMIIPTFGLLMGVIFYALKIGFKKRSYAIRTHDIIYQSGILSTKSIIIPFQRIQHVAVNEGFLSRRHGLAQLQIFTAGGSSSDIKISGLLKENAERMKELILLQISSPNREDQPTSPDQP